MSDEHAEDLVRVLLDIRDELARIADILNDAFPKPAEPMGPSYVELEFKDK